ncbi:MAG: class I SAM-dependent methyltransferase [Oleispira antarctica]|uniref:Methyltransferase n=1 Tax=Oleispira antarctica RB-8 TaxID=698738 RepID=R4YVB6_OLEAN|nr:class I SAM-dependent methyltransferase [Oleispira antarctica]MBQ0794210.1 class I SAM-dependent methyltransferase [Oleispira antarctica]CCK77914.1 Methyltransferase [Oleispira antarctica RB-8]
MFDTTESYQAIFNQRADAYHQAMLNWPEARNQEFLAILQDLPINSATHILDIPAGGGYLANYLPNDIRLHHLETSELFATLFQQHCHSGSQHPLSLCTLDELPEEDNSIDIAVSLAGLHHTKNKQPLFDELYRCLNPGGLFVLADAEDTSATARFLDGWVSDHNTMGHNGWYLNQHTIQQLKNSGFECINQENRDYHWVFNSQLQAGEYCKLMFGIDRADEREVSDALAKELGFDVLNDGRIGLRWQLHFITLRKPFSKL